MFQYRVNNYDRLKAKAYLEKYALNPNTDSYPYFKTDDCANFISQALHAGGIPQIGTSWDSLQSWFCRTTTETQLTKISITWRAARYFRRHWGNENGLGFNRAYNYYALPLINAIANFSTLYATLKIGDVIQHGSPLPFHTQMIYDKRFNPSNGMNDLFMAQHTYNRLNFSLYDYLMNFINDPTRIVYIYQISPY